MLTDLRQLVDPRAAQEAAEPRDAVVAVAGHRRPALVGVAASWTAWCGT
jgi:hypothetical protein